MIYGGGSISIIIIIVIVGIECRIVVVEENRFQVGTIG